MTATGAARAVPALSIVSVLTLPGCASFDRARPEWLGGEPEWCRRTGIQREGDKVLVVGRSQARFGYREAMDEAVHDGHRQLSEAIVTRVESETTQRYEYDGRAVTGSRVADRFETEAKARSEADLPGVQVEDTWSRVLRTDARGREVVEAAALVSIPKKEFDEAARKSAETAEAKVLADRDLAFSLAEVAYEKGENARARRLLEGLLRRAPDDVRLRLFYAQVLEAEGRPDDARGEYRIVGEIDPDGAAGLAAARALERLAAGPPPPSPPPAVPPR